MAACGGDNLTFAACASKMCGGMNWQRNREGWPKIPHFPNLTPGLDPCKSDSETDSSSTSWERNLAVGDDEVVVQTYGGTSTLMEWC